ncbi:cyclic AMP-responsive element-binding protein 5-like isoform X1 [Nerophis lumbriciformis]|uniref:cyclic AMP-responsive element-binding protein 5-like isoform X1 n=2 Tax=Nerophis lumbriciformis TaxID=546530 RepID=UPI002ADF3C3B|nr:cyclic AMP-responsive element-binding protein 5-like isoform X1 [Nerophis lumbriciformis]XP_061838447.1 cyclic AMP-responsive element-binding protein 5-like isoform X1 [Nerophis lumbriciformis]
MLTSGNNRKLAYDMNDKQDRPYACGAPGCSQRFQFEEHLLMHRHKHEMTLRFSAIKTDTFTDQTPTPTRFLQNCDEVGLFKEIEEEFLQAQEEERSKQTVSHNGSSCMNQHQLKPQLHHQPPPPPHHHALQHPQPHGPLMGPSCSLAAQQAVSSLQLGSVCTQAPSTLSHSGPVPSPPSSSSLLHMRNRHRQPLPASLPGTLPDPAMQGASAQHMSMEKQMSCIMATPGPINNPACSSPQRSKQMMSHHYQHHHPVMVNPPSAMMEMMSQRHQAPPLQHHHHPHPQLTSLSYQQRCHPQHLGSPQSHQSPPSHHPQGSPPGFPPSVPAQVSPVPQQLHPCQSPHSQHALQSGGSCGRRRRSSEQDPDERRQKFLERNRAAATRCRQKRKLWVSSLEKKAEELTHNNLQLQNEVTSLRSEVGQLKQILLTHKDCPVTARQREAQGYTTGVSPGGSPTPVDSLRHLRAVQHNSITTSSAGGNTQQSAR